MAKTKIRRKSLSNKKRRSNKKKSVRRMKKVGGYVTCKDADTICKLGTNDMIIEKVNALHTFVTNHPRCETFNAGVEKDADVKFITGYEGTTEIKNDELLKKIENIIKGHKENSSTWNAEARELVKKYSTIKSPDNCNKEELLKT